MTRADLRQAGDLRVRMELQATDLVLAGAVGMTTNLVQPPYTATASSLDYETWKAVLRVGNNGRQVVLADVDVENGRNPGADAIVGKATPWGDRGTVLLMRDSAGPETVAALDRLLSTLRQTGWKVDSVSGAFHVSGAMNQARTLDKVSGALVIWLVQASGRLADALGVLLFAATALAGLRTVLVLAVTPFHVRRSRRWRAPWPISQRVGVIVPAYNEEEGIEATVRSVLASRHPVEVIVVDDGSTDRTAEVVETLQQRLARIRLIRQRNAGKRLRSTPAWPPLAPRSS
jgi:hypothetical protein